MTIMIILAHPDPASFNHAIAETVVGALEENGHSGVLHDLYAEGFDPLLPAEEIARDGMIDPVIREHCDQLAASDGLVIVHPNWWGMPPAVLKGWVDRVMRPGVAYEFEEGDSGEGIPIGLLRARTAVVFNTSNTPEEREREAFGDPLERLWRDCIFDLCGVKYFYRRNFGVIVTSTLEQREAWLEEARQLVNRLFP